MFFSELICPSFCQSKADFSILFHSLWQSKAQAKLIFFCLNQLVSKLSMPTEENYPNNSYSWTPMLPLDVVKLDDKIVWEKLKWREMLCVGCISNIDILNKISEFPPSPIDVHFFFLFTSNRLVNEYFSSGYNPEESWRNSSDHCKAAEADVFYSIKFNLSRISRWQ